jgi:hypothetical protein
MHLASNIYLELKLENFLCHQKELVFDKILILGQFFIQFQFSCVNLTDQIFMSFLFHIVVEDLEHDPVENPRLASPR